MVLTLETCCLTETKKTMVIQASRMARVENERSTWKVAARRGRGISLETLIAPLCSTGFRKLMVEASWKARVELPGKQVKMSRRSLTWRYIINSGTENLIWAYETAQVISIVYGYIFRATILWTFPRGMRMLISLGLLVYTNLIQMN